MRLQARRLVCLDVGGCGALRTLQVSGLERAMAELQAEARASKVGALGLLGAALPQCPGPPGSFEQARIDG